MLIISHTYQNTLNKTKIQLKTRVSHSYVSNIRLPHYIHKALHQQLSVSLFLVCIEVRQKLTSHRYVENGSNVKIALFARVGNSLEVANQKFSKGRSAKLNFKPRSYLSLVSFSCSCKIISFPPTDAELFVSLTQSRHSVEAEEK